MRAKPTLRLFLLRVSLAFNSMGVYPSTFATRLAVVVFPMPGGPEISAALKEASPVEPRAFLGHHWAFTSITILEAIVATFVPAIDFQ